MRITNRDIKDIFDNYLQFDIAKKTREYPIPHYRFVFFKLCKEYSYDFTTTSAAKIMNLSHSNLVTGINRVNELMKQDKRLSDFYGTIKTMIELHMENRDLNDVDCAKLISENKKLITENYILMDKYKANLELTKTHKLITEISELTTEQLDEFYDNRWLPYRLMNIRK